MTPPLPTERQLEVLRAIARLTAAHGYPPSIVELRQALGITSHGAVQDHIRALHRKGLLTSKKFAARTWLLTELGEAVIGRAPAVTGDNGEFMDRVGP